MDAYIESFLKFNVTEETKQIELDYVEKYFFDGICGKIL